jgi:hypothetical protein
MCNRIPKSRYISDDEVEFLHRLRKKRHSIKYYGRILSEESIKRNVEKGKELFLKLRPKIEENLFTWKKKIF